MTVISAFIYIFPFFELERPRESLVISAVSALVALQNFIFIFLNLVNIY